MAPSAAQLTLAAEKLIFDISTNVSTSRILSHFSQNNNVIMQHSWSTCPNPNSYRFTGLNAVRSYFDLLSTHYERSSLMQHSIHVVESTGCVIITASVQWTWKSSRHQWQEDYTCYIDYDSSLHVVSFIVVTTSPDWTCVMRATDARVRGPSIKSESCSKDLSRFEHGAGNTGRDVSPLYIHPFKEH
ncbi:hypothetical protein CPB85DRAFT_892234 [Mucidula mucida]|nr:hypothetical protein CPB85DRAFT_892234 [Mucidula mucida]